MTRQQSPVIAHVLNGLRFGGNEVLCLQLIKSSPPWIRHTLFNMDPERVEMREEFESCAGITIIDRPYRRNSRLAFVLGMTRDLKRVGADGVLVYTFGLHLLVAVSARLAGINRVVARAGNPPPLDPRQRRLWTTIVLASQLLRVPIKSCSTAVDRKLRALTGDLPAGSEAVPNGVDVARITAVSARERSQRPRGGPLIVGMVARLNPMKDHETLLRAFAMVRQQIGSELWLVGDGELRSPLAARVADLGIDGSVRFLGERTDVHSLLGKMDVFVLATTHDEGFGIALAEAMAARTPIVASDVDACREVLGGGIAGRLTTPGNAEQLAAAIIELLTQPEVARALADSAHAYVREHFDIAACARRYYASLLPEYGPSF